MDPPVSWCGDFMRTRKIIFVFSVSAFLCLSIYSVDLFQSIIINFFPDKIFDKNLNKIYILAFLKK